MRKAILLAVLLLSTGHSWANIVINGTRVLYPENNKEVIVQLMNTGDSPALVQSWIDDGDINSTPETAKVPFLLSPPVIKVSGHNGQQLRIKKLPANLPADRESVFFLNVLDIPPKPENLQNQNTVQLAIKSRIKLFYRPASLAGSLDNAVEKLTLTANGNQFRINNNSPFHITVANISRGKTKLLNESPMVSPFGQLTVATKNDVKRGQTFQLMYVDDLGAYKTRTFTSQ
ncbi:fimbrial biogenesis chaperone [Enterobacter wuhouensis]|uniref:Molecular chaperone n=1 Tax=Enterobacter wuhouensis TaxID=2529381 RepID=A0A4R0G7W2_9ENTR|nr:molecular chaperone [Enterobacter wuhouensis]MCV2534085.1 molecular chaperone [Enterobacter wuhouensis]TCB91428.1 molecular chaperone [Enterobacter wuhouensis]WRW31626.1 molecular chaperone [Enterobacter wuhouensis]